MNFNRGPAALLVLLILLSMFLFAGCGGKGGGGGSGTDIGSIELSISSDNITADGFSSTTISIDMRQADGQPVALGTDVRLETTLGKFSQNGQTSINLSTSDDSGQIDVSLIAGTTAGTAVLTATAGGVTQRINITFEPDTADPGTTAAISMNTSNSNIPADGISSTTINVQMTRSDGTPVGQGVSVTLTTNLGAFDLAGSKIVTRTTEDNTGQITLSVIAGTEAGLVEIVASSGEVTQKLNLVFTSQQPGSVLINLAVDQPSLVADGQSSTTLTVTLTTANNNQPVPIGTTVEVTTTLGTFSATGTESVVLTTQDNSGITRVALIAPNDPGTGTISAVSGGTSQTLTINFIGEQISFVISFGSSTSVLPADGASSAALTITVTKPNGDPVDIGTLVTVETTLGTFDINGNQAKIIATSDTSGEVNLSLIAGTIPGIARIIATVGDVTQLLNITLAHAGNLGEPAGEAFGLAAEFINVSGWVEQGIEDVITAFVADFYGNAVRDNVAIDFKTYNTGGSLLTNTTPTTNGTATSTLVTTPNPAAIQGYLSITTETQGDPTTRITSLAVAPPPNNNIMYGGTNGGGVYKSINGGATWENMSRSPLNPRRGQNHIQPYIKGHSSIAIDPDNHNTVYVGTGFSGRGEVYRSFDGGLNWNSNNVEEWTGLMVYRSFEGLFDIGSAAVLSVLCDGDDDPATDLPFVWIGTEGRGILFSEDGSNFQPSGGVVVSGPTADPGNDGKGFMTSPILWYSSVSETWTATATVVPASATSPTIAANSQGTGSLEISNVSESALSESWTVTYQVTNSQPQVSFGNVGDGVATNFQFPEPPNAPDETWTIICIDDEFTGSQPAGTAVFDVISSVLGRFPVLEITGATANYNQSQIRFTLSQGSSPFRIGDSITITRRARWLVQGVESGTQTNTAITGNQYRSDNGEITFLIREGNILFADGDRFTFNTIARATVWTVTGSVSGEQERNAFDNTFYTSDELEVSFTIVSDDTAPFETGDTFTFSVEVNSLGHGRVVWDIERVPNTHGGSAILYAAANTGVFRSVNGGRTWGELANFTGDAISSLELFPSAIGDANDIIYAGTQQFGVWVSSNSGGTWVAQNKGLDTSQSINIRDLVVDPVNNYLYAIAYIGSPLQGLGKIYAHELNDDGNLTDAGWREVTNQLPDPMPPPHALALNDPSNPTQIYVGTEGINLYTATEGVASGNPIWRESKNGLTNTLMARMPILFSGPAAIWLRVEPDLNGFWVKVYVEDINGNPPIAETTYSAIYDPADATPEVLEAFTYPDSLIHRGTFRDPSDPRTDLPFLYRVPGNPGDELTIQFASPNTLPDPPGVSGSDSITIPF